MATDNQLSTAPANALMRAAFVCRAHGVGGEVRVEPLGQDPNRFVVGMSLIREDDGGTLTVHSVRRLGDGNVLLSFEELPTRESTRVLNNIYLCVDREEARDLDDDEWFVSDLVGLRAITEDGEELGLVTEVEPYAAHDVLVVGGGTSAKRFPMVREFVVDVDIANGTITLAPWEEA